MGKSAGLFPSRITQLEGYSNAFRDLNHSVAKLFDGLANQNGIAFFNRIDKG
jgi:hypothetical protein